MTSNQETTPTDLEKLLGLLNEYTGKLREVCEEIRTARYRRFQSMIMAAIGLSAAGAMFAIWFVVGGPPTKGAYIATMGVAVVIGATFVAFMTWTWMLRIRRQLPMGVEQVAATVERLIKLASQYQEHASQRIGERFEFELRLAEAEGALRVYRSLTGRPRVDWD